MAFAENLRRHRLEQFLSQAELARRAGLHAVTLTRLEGGATAPSARTVRALAGALSVEPRALAAPDEVAEADRRAAQARPGVGYHLDTWDDDGGAAQTEAGGHAGRARSRAKEARP
jgi:transcriptional regulator with XRE-family HTH domain